MRTGCSTRFRGCRMDSIYAEGKARVSGKNAFVNKDAKLTRDIGVAIASKYAAGGDVIDSTAATGIRGIRYMLEASAKSATFLEINKSAYSTLKKNLVINKVKGRAMNTSIQEFANSSEERFDIIDLDPFGGIGPYLNDLFKVAKDGSLLFATATDTAVLCGAHRNACIRLYGAVPMHNELCREAGLRLLVGHVARVAASFNFGIGPLASIVYKHYMRVHVKLSHGSKHALASMKSMGYAAYCSSCMERHMEHGLIPREVNCGECGAKTELGGPLWAGKLHDKETLSEIRHYFVGNRVENVEFVERLCNEIEEPLYYSIPRMTRFLNIESVSPYKAIDFLREKGFTASTAHFDSSAVKTNAGVSAVKDALKSLHG